VQGLAAVPSVMDIDGTIDFALIAVPAKHVAQTIRDAGAKGAKAALCFSSGFAEMGEAGAALEVEVIRAARETGVRLIGPNCLGAFNAETGFIPCFSSALERGAPITGGLAIVSQSGAYGSHIYWLARQRGLGTRYFMTTGNEADVGVSEVIGLMADDPDVHCIMAYAEGIRNGPQLIESLEKARAARKPVFVMKVGRSAVGAAAASSHTASLAGEDAVHDAILRQHGAVRVRTTEEMLDAADAARTRVYPVGNRLGVVTISGGAGVLIADEADARGLDVAPMPEDAQAELREILPFAAPRNPVDVTAQAFNDLNLVTLFLQKMIERGDYDSLLCFWTSVAGSAIMADKLLAAMRAGIAGQKGLLVVQSIIADAAVTKRYTDDGYPVFEDPSRAVAAIDALTRAGMAFAAGRPVMPPVPAPAALPDGPLTEGVAAAALAIAGVPMATAALACSAGDAAALAAAAGGPVAIKIASPDIAHKTDAGGVALGVAPEDAAAAFDAMMIRVRGHAPDAVIEGALISAMAPPGVDLILGAKTDPAFGPVVMVGLGGVFAEVFHDVAFRRAPVTHGVALEMLRSLRGWPLLDGARGAALADVDAAAAAVSALSIFAASQGAAIDSVEINPLRVLPAGQGALGLDALIVRGG
jgi:acyl-CoA synthetase (NDP forming)